MNRIDVTLAAIIDNAALDYKNATNNIMKKFEISKDIAELAMGKALADMREERMYLYASALYNSNIPKKENDINGDQND